VTQKISLRPHYHRKGDEIFFMISKRPVLKLNADEAALWDALPLTPAIESLAAGSARAVPRFLELGLCDLIPDKVVPSRKQILVVEPHCDDAALSIGGILWKWRNSHEFTIATLAGRSNFTSYFFSERLYSDPQQVSDMRDAEGVQYARMIGGHYIGLRNNEATLRFQDSTWDKEWFGKNKFAVLACNNHRSGRGEHEVFKNAALSLFKKVECDEVWLPLGAGQHTDHELTRNACFELLAEKTFAGKIVRIYSDVPYDHKFPEHKRDILQTLEKRGAKLTEESTDISDAMEQKLQLLSVFGSQFKLDAVRHGVMESARLAGGGTGQHESLWRVDVPPKSWDWLEVDPYPARTAVEKQACTAWLEQFAKTKTARFLLLNPAGRFKDDVLWLRDIAKDASFECYVSPSAADEVATANLPLVKQINVGEGSANWAKLAARLALSQRLPTIFVAGDRVSQARKLAKLWPGSKTLVAVTLDEIMRDLHKAKR
jgi:LmbE family N-acetylglucosaminyl deacetylase